MEQILFSSFLVIGIAFLAHGLRHHSGIYEYPFLAAATFLGFVGPQLPAILDDRFLPDGSVVRLLVVTILCLFMCGLGWAAGGRPFDRALKWKMNETALLWAAAGLSVFGAFFFFKISSLPEEVRSTNTPSGVMTIYLFLSRMTGYGFVIATICCARRVSVAALSIMAFDSIFLVGRILETGKRGELTEFVLALLLAGFFQRRLVVPRALFLSAALLAAIALTSVEGYRKFSRAPNGVDWAAVMQIDVLENFKALLENGGPEIRNATLRIQFINENQAFDYGLTYWNVMVHSFVPAQVVGPALKDKMFIPLPDQEDRFYSPDYGTTETAMADAFASFGYFGALKLYLIAYLLGRIYRTALQGFALPQIIYILSITPAMESITHQTQWIFLAWTHMGLLLLPFLFLTRVRRSETSAASAGAGDGQVPVKR